MSRILIIVQNLPVPFDRRVWLECKALVSAGHEVTVVCPKGNGDPAYAVVDTVRLYKYRPYAPGGSKIGFITEYVVLLPGDCMAHAQGQAAVAGGSTRFRRAIRRISSGRSRSSCGPLTGPCSCSTITICVPSSMNLAFLTVRGSLIRGLLALERRTHRTANHVISTNESYREIAITRSGKASTDVTVVRTGPDPDRLFRGPAEPELRRGRRFLAVYIGVMGPQDGVDIVLRAAAIIVHEFHRDDIAITLIGSGDCFDELVALRDELDLGGHVEFTGRAPDDLVSRIMSTADVGLSPDPKNPLNDLSTMNKTMEYMAFELPVVAFDLRETRVSAGDAAIYVKPNDVRDYAHAVVDLMDDESTRTQLGKLGRAQVEQELAWSHQERAYLGVYEALLESDATVQRTRG